MTQLEEFFDDLQAEYAAMQTDDWPRPTVRARIKGTIFDIRVRLASWINPERTR